MQENQLESLLQLGLHTQRQLQRMHIYLIEKWNLMMEYFSKKNILIKVVKI